MFEEQQKSSEVSVVRGQVAGRNFTQTWHMGIEGRISHGEDFGFYFEIQSHSGVFRKGMTEYIKGYQLGLWLQQ